jgi:hypothetical protein
MLRSIVVAAIITGAASMAQAQTAPYSVPGRLAFLPIGTPVAASDIPAGSRQIIASAAVAKAAIEARGYREVKNLSQDPVGNWAAEAVHDRMEVAVVLQVNGEIEEE